MRWPNLYLAGAPRCGTTAVFSLLAGHPEVFMAPAKEPGFLATGGAPYDLEHRHVRQPGYFISTVDDYERLFRHARHERYRGDATPHYLHHPTAPQRIAHYAPDAQVVVVLRSPAARAASAHAMERRDGDARGTFADAVRRALESGSLPPMLATSFYAEALARYHAAVGADRVHVGLHADLVADPDGFARWLWAVLGLDPVPTRGGRGPANVAGTVRFPRVVAATNTALDHRIMRQVHLYGPAGLGQRLERVRDLVYRRVQVPDRLDPGFERLLNRSLFRADIEATAERTGLDLAAWIA